jgi:hypothetical protein
LEKVGGAMADDDDRERAEFEYLTMRLSELSAKLQRNEAELDTPINDETAQQIVADVIKVLRDAGKSELAVRYEFAIEVATSAIEHHKELIRQGEDDVSISAARELQDDAIEELQRVDAEVDAFFDAGSTDGR